MTQPKLNDADFVEMFDRLGGTAMGRQLGMSVRAILERRRRLEGKLGRDLGPSKEPKREIAAESRLLWGIRDGVVLVGSDAHYWPGAASTAHRALVAFAKRLKPVGIVMNGDVFDGAGISRHPPIGWERQPSVIEQIEACKERLGELALASPRSKRAWPLGNHDARFETRLATVAPEYAQVHGVHLRDHFGEWEPCWSVWINDAVVIKHRFKGGIHATHNNALWAGKTIVTGHLHSLQVRPFSDYTGTRFGVDTGTLAEVLGPQFADYTEDNPKNWRSGFVVLTFKDGELLWPEVVNVRRPGVVEFRGEVFNV